MYESLWKKPRRNTDPTPVLASDQLSCHNKTIGDDDDDDDNAADDDGGSDDVNLQNVIAIDRILKTPTNVYDCWLWSFTWWGFTCLKISGDDDGVLLDTILMRQ